MELAEYKKEFKNNIIDLLSQEKNSTFFKKSELWDWQYNQNPLASNSRKGIIVLEGGKFAGFNGLMPVKLKYLDDIINVYWSVDTILDPICRGKGFGGKLVDAVKKSSPVVIGFGISDIQAHIMRKHGYKVNPDIAEYFYVNKPYDLKNVVKKSFQYWKIVKNFFNAPPVRGDLKISILESPDIPKKINYLWEKVKDKYSKIIVRNYSYIKWRYGNHPLMKYQFIIIESNKELFGLGVFRKNNDVSRLVDYVGPSKNIQIKYLIVKTFKKMCSQSRLLSCICTDEELQKALGLLGFRRHNESPRFYVYSNIKNDRNPENNWFIMSGDSDSDWTDF